MATELNCKTTLHETKVVGEGKYIRFILVGRSLTGKTNIYWVQSKEEDSVLGQINWYSAWYQYAFFPQSPNMETVFEKNCLRDIANFCEEQTKLQRKGRTHGT
jgi:hypothetical protein